MIDRYCRLSHQGLCIKPKAYSAKVALGPYREAPLRCMSLRAAKHQRYGYRHKPTDKRPCILRRNTSPYLDHPIHVISSHALSLEARIDPKRDRGATKMGDELLPYVRSTNPQSVTTIHREASWPTQRIVNTAIDRLQTPAGGVNTGSNRTIGPPPHHSHLEKSMHRWLELYRCIAMTVSVP